jgi:O-antigen ligase
MQSGGLDPDAAWYREAIWQTAGPMVLNSPLFGLGLAGDWDWQSSDALVGSSVDAFWLASAMMFGIPGTLLVFLTMAGAFWLGPIDKSPYLTREERRLSVSLGIIAGVVVFLGFTVHFWGTCWILLGVFAGTRANLAEAAILRRRAALQQSVP